MNDKNKLLRNCLTNINSKKDCIELYRIKNCIIASSFDSFVRGILAFGARYFYYLFDVNGLLNLKDFLDKYWFLDFFDNLNLLLHEYWYFFQDLLDLENGLVIFCFFFGDCLQLSVYRWNKTLYTLYSFKLNPIFF